MSLQPVLERLHALHARRTWDRFFVAVQPASPLQEWLESAGFPAHEEADVSMKDFIAKKAGYRVTLCFQAPLFNFSQKIVVKQSIP